MLGGHAGIGVLGKDAAVLWIKRLGLWKSGEALCAPGRRFGGSAKPDVGTFRALVEYARHYWSLMESRTIPQCSAAS